MQGQEQCARVSWAPYGDLRQEVRLLKQKYCSSQVGRGAQSHEQEKQFELNSEWKVAAGEESKGRESRNQQTRRVNESIPVRSWTVPWKSPSVMKPVGDEPKPPLIPLKPIGEYSQTPNTSHYGGTFSSAVTRSQANYLSASQAGTAPKGPGSEAKVASYPTPDTSHYGGTFSSRNHSQASGVSAPQIHTVSKKSRSEAKVAFPAPYTSHYNGTFSSSRTCSQANGVLALQTRTVLKESQSEAKDSAYPAPDTSHHSGTFSSSGTRSRANVILASQTGTLPKESRSETKAATYPAPTSHSSSTRSQANSVSASKADSVSKESVREAKVASCPAPHTSHYGGTHSSSGARSQAIGISVSQMGTVSKKSRSEAKVASYPAPDTLHYSGNFSSSRTGPQANVVSSSQTGAVSKKPRGAAKVTSYLAIGVSASQVGTVSKASRTEAKVSSYPAPEISHYGETFSSPDTRSKDNGASASEAGTIPKFRDDDQGDLIDRDLLQKILTNPILIEKLVKLILSACLIVQNSDLGALIDLDLLQKILTKPKLTEQLVTLIQSGYLITQNRPSSFEQNMQSSAHQCLPAIGLQIAAWRNPKPAGTQLMPNLKSPPWNSVNPTDTATINGRLHTSEMKRPTTSSLRPSLTNVAVERRRPSPYTSHYDGTFSSPVTRQSNGVSASEGDIVSKAGGCEAKVAPSHPTEAKVAPSHPTERKVAPSRPTETKVASSHPVETKVALSHSVEKKVASSHPVEANVAELGDSSKKRKFHPAEANDLMAGGSSKNRRQGFKVKPPGKKANAAAAKEAKGKCFCCGIDGHWKRNCPRYLDDAMLRNKGKVDCLMFQCCLG